jgi:hypothetical protein
VNIQKIIKDKWPTLFGSFFLSSLFPFVPHARFKILTTFSVKPFYIVCMAVSKSF